MWRTLSTGLVSLVLRGSGGGVIMGFSSEALGLLGVGGLDVAAGALPSTSSLLGTWSWEGFPAVADPFSWVSRVAGFCCPEAACS